MLPATFLPFRNCYFSFVISEPVHLWLSVKESLTYSCYGKFCKYSSFKNLQRVVPSMNSFSIKRPNTSSPNRELYLYNIHEPCKNSSLVLIMALVCHANVGSHASGDRSGFVDLSVSRCVDIGPRSKLCLTFSYTVKAHERIHVSVAESFRISLRWPIYIANSVDKTK